MKKRLDVLLCERYPNYSRTYLHTLIKHGSVQVNTYVVTKPGMLVDDDASIEVHDLAQRYVCRAGFKLEAALTHFALDVHDLVVLDAGLSTGGFTDCLLQHGARRVYGVDVGHGQVHDKIRNDARVVVMEKTNLRTLTSLPEPVDLVTLDLSFISVLLVVPAVLALLAPKAQILIMIKPQFEAGREYIREGGLVDDPAVHRMVIEKVRAGCVLLGLTAHGPAFESPLPGAESGNKEFFLLVGR